MSMEKIHVTTAQLFLAVALLLFAVPAVAAAQGGGSNVTVQGAVGGLLVDGGHSEVLSVGVLPMDRVGFLVSAERLHIPTEVTQYPDGYSIRRGSSSTFVSGELRFPFASSRRVSPYALAGGGRGKWRQNVNAQFPGPGASGDATLIFAGGGVRVPLTDHLSAFADLRFVLQFDKDTEDGFYPFYPLRAGLSLRF